jgi:alpha-ketoglutarate-dependent 2,4-dichlorophenoxyacetate dioxygenase
LRAPLDTATVAAIDAAMDRYAVLVFRDQPLSEDQQVAFALALRHAGYRIVQSH